MARGVGQWRYDEAQLQRRLWTPDLLKPNLLLWLDAADLSTITIATGVSQWRDKSEFGRHVSQATPANQPTYISSDPTLANKPVVNFISANNTWLQGSFPTTGISTISIAAVTRWQTTGSIQALIDNEHNGSPTQGFFWQDRPDLTNRPLTVAHIPNVTNGAMDTVQTGNNTWKQISSLFQSGIGDTLFVNGQQKAFLNNTEVFNLRPTLRIGGSQLHGRPFNGEFAEIVIVSSYSSSDRQKLEGYLAHKWGLNQNLLATHPFANRPPLIGD